MLHCQSTGKAVMLTILLGVPGVPPQAQRIAVPISFQLCHQQLSLERSDVKSTDLVAQLVLVSTSS